MTNTIEDTRMRANDALPGVASPVVSPSGGWYSRAARLVKLGTRLAPLVPVRAIVVGLARIGLGRTSATPFASAASFTAGLFVGGVITALGTPWSGAELRGEIAAGFDRAETALAEAEPATKPAETKAVDGAHDTSTPRSIPASRPSSTKGIATKPPYPAPSLVANAKPADRRESPAVAIRDPKRAHGRPSHRG